MQQQELIFQGVPVEAILPRPESDNSFKELYNGAQEMHRQGWDGITVIMHNNYQVDRIVKMYDLLLVYAQIQRPGDENLHNAIIWSYYNASIRVLPAEDIMAKFDPEFRDIYNAAMATNEGQNTVAAERKGQGDLPALRYGVRPSAKITVTMQEFKEGFAGPTFSWQAFVG